MEEKLYTEEELRQQLEQQRKQMMQFFADIMDTVIVGMASVIESRDNSTGNHVRRTSKCVGLFAQKLVEDPKYHLDRGFALRISKAAPLHDLGKLQIPDVVLQKPGRFTAEEYQIMKDHSQYGASLIYKVLSENNDTDFVHIAINMAHFHHERWDGSGYPKGLVGEEIPLESRIMALADVFDALVSKRCYKDRFSFDEAFGIIEESLGTHFDPDLGRAFLSMRKELEALYSKLFSEGTEGTAAP